MSRSGSRTGTGLLDRHGERAVLDGVLDQARWEGIKEREVAQTLKGLQQHDTPKQGSSWFPLHMCGVKPTVSEELQFNQRVCGVEAKDTLHPCETSRSYCRTSVVPTQPASIRTGVNELMSRAVTAVTGQR